MECPYFEPDEFGDICHSEIDIECPDPFNCTAIYDGCGNQLHEDLNGLDEETYGFY